MVDATTAVITVDAGDTTEIIAAPGASQKIKIVGLVITCSENSTTVTLLSGATPFSGIMKFNIGQGFHFSSDLFPIALGTNEAFNITAAVGNVTGYVSYIIG